MAKRRDAEKHDGGEKSSGKRSDVKKPRSIQGKSRAEGKQQESSTHAEKTTRD
jgi:hypothetical protein